MSRLNKAFKATMVQMYKEAEPPIDWKYAWANPDEYEHGWWTNHTLDGDRQREIVDKYAKEYDLSSEERMALVFSAILDYGPANA